MKKLTILEKHMEERFNGFATPHRMVDTRVRGLRKKLPVFLNTVFWEVRKLATFEKDEVRTTISDSLVNALLSDDFNYLFSELSFEQKSKIFSTMIQSISLPEAEALFQILKSKINPYRNPKNKKKTAGSLIEFGAFSSRVTKLAQPKKIGLDEYFSNVLPKLEKYSKNISINDVQIEEILNEYMQSDERKEIENIDEKATRLRSVVEKDELFRNFLKRILQAGTFDYRSENDFLRFHYRRVGLLVKIGVIEEKDRESRKFDLTPIGKKVIPLAAYKKSKLSNLSKNATRLVQPSN